MPFPAWRKKFLEGGEKDVDHCVIRFGRNLRVWLAEAHCLLLSVDSLHAEEGHASILQRDKGVSGGSVAENPAYQVRVFQPLKGGEWNSCRLL